MQLSGTSVSAPLVSGAAAVMLEANPSLTPNMVKMILMYTAQSLKGYNMLEQGAGEVNVEGAVLLAKLVRTDLSASTAVGSPMLKGPAPVATTTIAGETFKWAQGVILNHNWVAWLRLMTKYQAVYGLGVLLSDGVIVSEGVIVSDMTKLSNGVLVGDNILISTGITMSDGIPLMSSGVLMGDGVLLSDGVLVGDGVLVSDGVIVSDFFAGNSYRLFGDNTNCMNEE